VPEILLGRADYLRNVAKEGHVVTLNRYFEGNPVLTTDSKSALISRPGQRRWIYVGAGPIRAVYSQPGTFGDALFVVSADGLYKVAVDGTVTLLTLGLLNNGGSISMCATGNIGDTPEFLFVADGRTLWLYVENGFARGTLTGSPANNDVVQLSTVYYKFTNGSVDAGTPAGTLANPWLVALGAGDANSFQNLSDAINFTGTPGTQYSTALVKNPDALAIDNEANSLTVRAVAIGAAGNSIVTTETGANLAWGAGTLTGGGDPSVTGVQTPDSVGIISVGYSASYVICVPAQGQGINGRFYWIKPGETTIDPLDFATAERAPDPIFNVIVFGDQFWLPGSNTTEVWYFTGNTDSPVLRLQGVTFDRGTWEGTAIQIKESMIIVDNDGGVFQISGGLNRISNPAVEERIREAIAYQAYQTS
jgi:hypothetical protein